MANSKAKLGTRKVAFLWRKTGDRNLKKVLYVASKAEPRRGRGGYDLSNTQLVCSVCHPPPAVQQNQVQLHREKTRMATPSVQRVFEVARRGLGRSGHQLKRRSRVCLGNEGQVAAQRRHNSSEASSAVPATVPAVNIAGKGQGLTSPAPAGGASVATRKRPANGYLNKVGERASAGLVHE